MKTINFITAHFLPENTACTNRVLSFVQELEKHNIINIICLTEKGVNLDTDIVSHSKNVTIHYVYQTQFDGSNFIGRAFHEIKYVLKLNRLANSIKSDVTIATSPYMFIIPIIGFLTKGSKILDIRDLVWEYLDDRGVINKFTKITLRYIMKSGICKFDEVLVTNEFEYNILESSYGIRKINLLTNGIDRIRFENLCTINLKEGSDFILTYAGNIGIAQNLMILIEASILLPEVNFIIIGDGVELHKLTKYAKENNCKNVEFKGKLAWEEIKYYYSKSSVLYAQLDNKFISAMPSKLYEYASVGLPIIYGGVGQAHKFVLNLQNSIAIEPNSVDLIVNAIDIVKKKKITISTDNREFVEQNFIREEAAKIINHLIGNK